MKNKETKGCFCQNSEITPLQQAVHYILKAANFQGEKKTFDTMLDRLAETIFGI